MHQILRRTADFWKRFRLLSAPYRTENTVRDSTWTSLLHITLTTPTTVVRSIFMTCFEVVVHTFEGAERHTCAHLKMRGLFFSTTWAWTTKNPSASEQVFEFLHKQELLTLIVQSSRRERRKYFWNIKAWHWNKFWSFMSNCLNGINITCFIYFS